MPPTTMRWNSTETSGKIKQIYTLNTDNPEDCAKKFKSNSLVGLIILLGILGGGYKQYLENRQKNRGKEDLSVTRSCVFG